MPGPVPKRSDQRRRQNLPEPGRELRKVTETGPVRVPAASKDWHPVAARWYRSLKQSGQARYYEPSDWAYAYLVAEMMSAGLEKGWGQTPLGTGSGVQAQVVLGAMAPLLVTEADRRRARVEIEREDKPKPTPVTAADDYRRRLGA